MQRAGSPWRGRGSCGEGGGPMERVAAAWMVVSAASWPGLTVPSLKSHQLC